MSICPPFVPFPTPHYPIPLLPPPYVFLCYYVFTYSVPYVIMSSVLCYHVFTYSVPYVFMSFWLLFLCYHVFYILCPLCLYVFMSSDPLLPCLLHTLSPMSLCHSGFRSSVTMSFTYSVPYVFMSL